MQNTQASCFGTVGNQNPAPELPALHSPVEPITFAKATVEDDNSRSLRLFGRKDVRLSRCGGPCAPSYAIEMAFAR